MSSHLEASPHATCGLKEADADEDRPAPLHQGGANKKRSLHDFALTLYAIALLVKRYSLDLE